MRISSAAVFCVAAVSSVGMGAGFCPSKAFVGSRSGSGSGSPFDNHKVVPYMSTTTAETFEFTVRN